MEGVDEEISVAFKVFNELFEEEDDIEEPHEEEDDRLSFLFEVGIFRLKYYLLTQVCEGGRHGR